MIMIKMMGWTFNDQAISNFYSTDKNCYFSFSCSIKCMSLFIIKKIDN